MENTVADESLTTAIGLARYAFEYIKAAQLVDDHAAENSPEGMISPTPAYFLAYHGIELTLKAYLRHRGLTVKELSSMKFGHNLHKCYKKSKELGLCGLFKEHSRDVDAMRMLVDLNLKHGLRYIRTGFKEYPLWSLVNPLMVRLHQAVAPVVGFKTFSTAFGGY